MLPDLRREAEQTHDLRHPGAGDPLTAGDAWALVWLRGEYRAFTNYNQAAVGLIFRGPPD